MTVAELLEQLERLDISVRLDGERLRLNAPKGVLTPDLEAELRQRREELIEFLRKARKHSARSRIVPLQPNGPQPAFFGIPGHAGDVFDFVPLARALGPEQPFFAYQPPGVDGLRAPLSRVEDLAEDFIAELRAFQREGPYRIGGFCTGGTIAFEAARRLTARGEDVTCLVLFGSSSPSSSTLTHRILIAPVRVMNRCTRLFRFWRHGVPENWPDHRGSASEVDRQRVEQASLRAVRAYRTEPYGGSLTLFIPSDNWRGFACERYRDWERLCADFELHVGPPHGMHRTMLREPDVQLVAKRLREVLRASAEQHARA